MEKEIMVVVENANGFFVGLVPTEEEAWGKWNEGDHPAAKVVRCHDCGGWDVRVHGWETCIC